MGSKYRTGPSSRAELDSTGDVKWPLANKLWPAAYTLGVMLNTNPVQTKEHFKKNFKTTLSRFLRSPPELENNFIPSLFYRPVLRLIFDRNDCSSVRVMSSSIAF